MATNTFKRKISAGIGTTATAVGGYSGFTRRSNHSDWFGSGKRYSFTDYCKL